MEVHFGVAHPEPQHYLNGFWLCGRSSSFRSERAITFHQVIAARFIESLLWAGVAKPSLIFTIILAGRGYYYMPFSRLRKIVSLPKSQFLRTVTAMLFKMSKVLAGT